MLRLARSLEAFTANPAGSYMCGPHYLYICEREDLYAFYLWGRPGGAETRELIEVLRVEVRPRAQRHHSFVDLSGLTWIDSDAFSLMRDFVESVKTRQREVTVREAVVRPSGVPGAVVAGFFALHPQPYPTQVFSELEAATDWLGVTPAELRSWCHLRESLRGVAPELAQLRELLASHCREADVAFAAKSLACAPRTLQRRLRDWGTAFHRELDAARLEGPANAFAK